MGGGGNGGPNHLTDTPNIRGLGGKSWSALSQTWNTIVTTDPTLTSLPAAPTAPAAEQQQQQQQQQQPHHHHHHHHGRIEISGSANSKEASSLGQDDGRLGGRGRDAVMIAYIEESSCYTAGYVYKVPVVKPGIGSEKYPSPTFPRKMGTVQEGDNESEGTNCSSVNNQSHVSIASNSDDGKDGKLVPPLPPLHPSPVKSVRSQSNASSLGVAGGNSSNNSNSINGNNNGNNNTSNSAQQDDDMASLSHSDRENGYIIISWIYDIIESTPKD
eukprot:scaffold879_cov170-Ochromonas_danica.AAC.6